MLADALQGQLDIVLVRKLGAPFNAELALGAVDEQGRVELNHFAERYGGDADYVAAEAARQLKVIRQRRRQYGLAPPAPSLAGRIVIVVDDGLATGATMQSALDSVRARGPEELICAVPVGAAETVQRMAAHADRVVCLATPALFGAVGFYYRDFRPVEDTEVIAILGGAGRGGPPLGEVRIPTGNYRLPGELDVPDGAAGLILFAHGSGSSRHSPRNRYVAERLQAAGLATLLFDLLDAEEDLDRAARFDIKRLAQRLSAAVDWAREQRELASLPIGLFGASTGAAAALRVAAQRPGSIAALVSRGGRPDLAGPAALARAQVPTLLIVGGNDIEVISLNRAALAALPNAQLEIVPRAGHLFEEPGALQRVAELAGDWFARCLR